MQNRFGKTRLHITEQIADQKEKKTWKGDKGKPKGRIHERAQYCNTKGMKMATTATLCRDSKHTINHNSLCFLRPLIPCRIQLHETPTITPTTRLLMICRFQSQGSKCSLQKKTHNFEEPTKISSHLTKRYHPNTLINLKEEIGMCPGQDYTKTSLKST